jgi:hypothetical protein
MTAGQIFTMSSNQQVPAIPSHGARSDTAQPPDGSDGSEAGAAIRRERPSATLIRAHPTLPTCGNPQDQPGQPGERSVVVLDVVGSSPIVHPKRLRS